jgi:serine protease
MRWAAGLPVSGVPNNPYPAKILNLSLGSAEPCNLAYQSVIAELAAIGVLVIASGGNDGGPVNSPANCSLALGVAGLRHAGTKVGYSSLGAEIAVAAPAGNCFNLSGPCLYSLHTTFDVGTTTPAGSDYTNQFNTNLGTSFSAPLATGVAALMHAANGKLSSAQLQARMQEGARAFPVSSDPMVPTCHLPLSPSDIQVTECNCTTAVCGAGMLHAPGALAAAQRPIASIAAPATFAAGSAITLDAIASAAACNRTISSYLWSVVSATGTSPPVLTIDNQPVLQVNAPLAGEYTLRITITDDQGAIDSGEIVINSTASTNQTSAVSSEAACPATITIAQEPAPVVVPPRNVPSSNEGHGGGGATTWHWLLLLALAQLRVRRVVKPVA